MTREERHIAVLSRLLENMDVYDSIQPTTERKKAIKAAIQALSQEPCTDAVSRAELLRAIDTWDKFGYTETGCFVRITKEIDNYVPYVHLEDVITAIQKLPPVTQKSGKCKNCKYFEYDSVAKVDGIPIIVAHEICNKWGDGCKTSEDGYCYLFEPQESEEKNDNNKNV